MRKLIFVIVFTFVVSSLFASNLVINMKNGEKHTFDTSSILSMYFSEEKTPLKYSIDGVWGAGPFGEVTFFQNNAKVTGKYMQGRGIIDGIMLGVSLEGIWTEERSSSRCDFAKNGSFFWGRIQLKFDGNKFIGNWGYCDEMPTRRLEGYKKP